MFHKIVFFQIFTFQVSLCRSSRWNMLLPQEDPGKSSCRSLPRSSREACLRDAGSGRPTRSWPGCPGFEQWLWFFNLQYLSVFIFTVSFVKVSQLLVKKKKMWHITSFTVPRKQESTSLIFLETYFDTCILSNESIILLAFNLWIDNCRTVEQKWAQNKHFHEFHLRLSVLLPFGNF